MTTLKSYRAKPAMVLGFSSLRPLVMWDNRHGQPNKIYPDISNPAPNNISRLPKRKRFNSCPGDAVARNGDG
jgi:hypothetical protein